MSLILTHPPRSDESGMGYYRRLAADNALFSWRNLTSTAGIERTRTALLTRTDDVARNLGLELAWTESAKQKENISRQWRRLHRAKSDAVCPACLAEATYLRHQWEHVYVTACPHHHIQLVDVCNACKAPLSAERMYIGLCSCGHDLCSLPRVPATQAQQWLSALIAGDPLADNLGPLAGGVDLDVLVKAIRILCLHGEPAKPALPRLVAQPKSVRDAIKFLAPLEVLLADWPSGFSGHVEQRIAAGRKDARTLNSLLGDWYISLRKLCQGTALKPLLQVILNVAKEKSDCVLGLDSAKAMAEDATGYLRVPDAARAIGVSSSRLHDSIQSGECAHRSRRTGTRGQMYEIPSEEVGRIQQRRSEWISDSTACELARVSPAVLERMKAAGVVHSDARWREDLLKGGPVERQSLQTLYERVKDRAVAVALVGEATLTWAELTSRRMGEKNAIESLMKAIADGAVKAISSAPFLGELAFLRSEVSQYFGTPLLEAGMSIQQLAGVTGWKWESISHWIEQGLLESESTLRRGQRCRVVLPHQLLAFRQNYIPLADLARAMGQKSSALSRALVGVTLTGAKPLPDGAMRGGLIRIADLGRLAVLGARAGTDLFVPAP